MSKKEEYTVDISCPECDQTGRATYSENENPVHGRGFDKRLENVSEGFKIIKGNIYCEKCKKTIKAV